MSQELLTRNRSKLRSTCITSLGSPASLWKLQPWSSLPSLQAALEAEVGGSLWPPGQAPKLEKPPQSEHFFSLPLGWSKSPTQACCLPLFIWLGRDPGDCFPFLFSQMCDLLFTPWVSWKQALPIHNVSIQRKLLYNILYLQSCSQFTENLWLSCHKGRKLILP